MPNNDNNRMAAFRELGSVKNKSQTIKGVGTSKVTRGILNENATTYTAKDKNSKKQDK
ncbi:hypothetical protein [Bacillus mycoides]|uniref:hypothetical protein n=1 Tax=Bacillus mycoides TaxID=1405 RepID=UPI001C036634|nr:hypothetical protein [Bacillus mycoides]